MSPDTPPQATEQCPECGEDFTGNATGRNGVKWKIGAHRARVHGYRNPDSKYKSKKTAADDNAKPTLTLISDMAGEAGAGKGSKRAPTAEEMSRALGRGLGIASVTVASYAAETDPTIPDGAPGEAARQNLVAYLSLEPADAVEAMRPIARLLTSTGINTKYGRTIVDNVDVVGGVGALVKVGLHWRRYFRERNSRIAVLNRTTPIDAASTVVPPRVWAPETADATPPPTEGRVLSAEDIAAMNGSANPVQV